MVNRHHFLILILIYFASSANAQNQCSNLFVSETRHHDEVNLTSQIVVEKFKKALEKAPLSVSDQFPTGPYGTNMIRSYRENKEPLDPHWVNFILTPQDFLKSYNEPVEIGVDGVKYEGSIFLYKNNIYRNNYFASKTEVRMKKIDDNKWLKIISEQPWFSWDSLSGEFKINRTDLQKNLINLIFSKKQQMSFYRGTFAGEYYLFSFLKELKNRNRNFLLSSIYKTLSQMNSDSALSKELLNLQKINFNELSDVQVQMIREKISQLYVDSISSGSWGKIVFITDKKSKAELFSKGLISKFIIDKSTMLSADEKQSVYLGFEGQLEVGFRGADAVLKLADCLVSSKNFEPTTNVFNFEYNHPIWRR